MRRLNSSNEPRYASATCWSQTRTVTTVLPCGVVGIPSQAAIPKSSSATSARVRAARVDAFIT
ncbi:Uncharacterised protein [Mycobacteroides abscessus subsp. abscessus]|nr:Uncharacterised protein [Mycobacteroides abscessus subsp. abscessus]